MTRAETYDLRAEFEAIGEELDELADEVAAAREADDLDADTLDAVDRGQELDRHYRGLAWALNEDAAGDERDRDAYERVTISELTAGSYIKAGAEANADSRDLDVPGGEVERLYRVANAIDAADFIDDHDDPLITVASLNPQFFFWLEDQVDELTTPEIQGNSFERRVRDRIESTDSESADASTSNSPE